MTVIFFWERVTQNGSWFNGKALRNALHWCRRLPIGFLPLFAERINQWTIQDKTTGSVIVHWISNDHFDPLRHAQYITIFTATYENKGDQLSICPPPLTQCSNPLDHFCKHFWFSPVSLLQAGSEVKTGVPLRLRSSWCLVMNSLVPSSIQKKQNRQITIIHGYP